MRHFPVILATACAALAVIGCAPEALAPDGVQGQDVDVLNAVLTATTAENPPATADLPDDAGGAPDSTDTAPTVAAVSRTFSGNVGGDGDYQLFELGVGNPGDEWAISPTGSMSGPFIVVLFDSDENLLMRMFMSYSKPLRLVLREHSNQVYLGIMPPSGRNGGGFQLNASVETGRSVPAPAPQVVWLNFAAGNNIRVHTRDGVSFPAFDGGMLGEAYEGHTQLIKDAILREMRADYASYNVTISSSDDGPPPDGPHSTVHFGSDESGLLGLADNVDNYNQNPTQDAIIYVENFAPYWTMQLEPDEMAVMIANVGSHELGHLLGLYHTQDPDDIMDTTGSAWDLAENQSFIRGPLEPTVFATGWEDSPRLLEQIVGVNPDSAKSVAREKSAKSATYKAIRRFAQEELTYTCGTCLSLDHE